MTIQEIENALRAKLEADQAQDQLGHKIHTTIAEVLKKFEGKKLTKRFTDTATEAIRVLFPNQHPCISWEHPGKCSVWVHDTIPFNDRVIFYVAPTGSPINPAYHGHWIGECHAAGFEQEDLCHGDAALERIRQREHLLYPNSAAVRGLALEVWNVQETWKKLDETCDLATFSTIGYEAKRLSGCKREWRGGQES